MHSGPRPFPARGPAWRPALGLLGLLGLLLGAALSPIRAQDGPPEPRRDFPPVGTPGRRAEPAPPPGQTTFPTNPTETGEPSVVPNWIPVLPDSENVYRVGVNDEIAVRTIGQPEFSAVVRVLPDGSMSFPGCGTIWAQGRTAAEIAAELKRRMSRLVRFPEVDAMVAEFADQRIYVMGEVNIPQDHEYRRGMTALQAVAQAGGFTPAAKRKNVFVLRRTGPSASEVFQLDLSQAFEAGEGPSDIILRPYDIVYVPKTLIANWNIFVDQVFRQNISPFTLFIEGWNAFHINDTTTIVRR